MRKSNESKPISTRTAPIFKKPISQQAYHYFSQQFQQQQQWAMDSSPSKNAVISQIFTNLLRASIKSLNLSENNHPQIIANIRDVHFGNLLHLSLSQNRISSIESMDRVYMPELMTLNLFDNCIVSVKSMRKFVLSDRLFVISLDDNFITDFHVIVGMPHQSVLREIGVDYLLQSDGSCEDIRWIVKLSNVDFKQIWIGKSDRIRQAEVMEVSMRKFTNVNLITRQPF